MKESRYTSKHKTNPTNSKHGTKDNRRAKPNRRNTVVCIKGLSVKFFQI